MKIAILGYGIVGSGAFEVLSSYGYEVKKVLDIRPHSELGDILTSNYDDILNDDEIKIVAEAIGGLEPAHTFVVKALKAGIPAWMAVDVDKLEGKVVAMPTRADIDTPVAEHLIVELYSK